MAAVYWYGAKAAPAVFAGYVVNGLLHDFSVPSALFVSTAGVGVVAEALLGAFLLRRAKADLELHYGLRAAVVLMVLAVLIAPIAAAVMGTLSLYWHAGVPATHLMRNFAVWWTGNAVGVLIMFPATLYLVFARQAIKSWRLAQAGPLVIAVVLTATIFVLVDARQSGAHAFEYLVFPFLAWGAITMSTSQVAAMNLLVVATATTGTAWGLGPYASSDGATNMWLLQAFVCTAVATALILRALTADQVRSDDQQRLLAQRFHAAADRNPSAVMLLHTLPPLSVARDDFAIAFANEQAKVMLPRLRKEGPLCLSEVLEHGMRDRCLGRYLDAAAHKQGLDEEDEVDLPHVGSRWWRHQAVPLDDGLMVTITDVTDAKRTLQEAGHLASHDSLTDLPNRARLHDDLDRALETAKLSHHLVAVLFLDLDNFKFINDGHGHDVGNTVLIEVAARLKQRIGAKGLVSRPGGDEFVVLVQGVKQMAEVERAAHNLVADLARPMQLGARELSITCSIGIAVYPFDAVDRYTLMRFADTAMYQAKRTGKNRYQFFDSGMNDNLRHRVAIEDALHGAFDRNEFSLVYQAQWSVKTGALVGVEALLRWTHAKLGTVPPDQFIPVAEALGMMAELGPWIVQTACKQCQVWRDSGYHVPRIAVNLSSQQLDARMAGVIRDALADAKIDASSLELDLTESRTAQDVGRNKATLHELSAMGVSMVIDDFGTGNASLSYLKLLPITAVKIAPSFVRGAAQSPDTRQVLTAVVALARHLSLRCVAKGVEAKAELELLRSIHCDECQGHLFGQPMPANELAGMHLTGNMPVGIVGAHG